jgi:hypothetical protein
MNTEVFNYFNACDESSEYQGTAHISRALTEAGIENTVEQTGGFTMVVYVYSKDKKKAITINSSSIGFEPDVEDLSDWVEITPHDFIPWEQEGCSPETCAELVKITQANLHLLEGK